jgi:D-cysteine desulfhydrase
MAAQPVTRSETRLMAEYPELARSVPWTPLADVPTPVEPCTSIAGYLGREGVWIKRDDLISPIYGGNKVRRFEHLIADARRREAKTLVTVGGLASTQVMATVLFGRATGFQVTVTLFDQPVTTFLRRALLTNASAGARLVYGGGYVTTAWRAWRAYAEAESPYLILPGASTPMALLGYVDAMLELGEQVRRGEMPRPDLIVLPAGSGGTVAALALGISMLRWPTTVIGIRITDYIACNRATIRLLIEATAHYLRQRSSRFAATWLPEPRFRLHHGAIGRGYGHATPEALGAVPEVERLTGTPGEITYSGKALGALRTIGREHPGKTILYWSTLSSTAPEPTLGPGDLPPELQRFFEGDVPI